MGLQPGLLRALTLYTSDSTTQDNETEAKYDQELPLTLLVVDEGSTLMDYAPDIRGHLLVVDVGSLHSYTALQRGLCVFDVARGYIDKHFDTICRQAEELHAQFATLAVGGRNSWLESREAAQQDALQRALMWTQSICDGECTAITENDLRVYVHDWLVVSFACVLAHRTVTGEGRGLDASTMLQSIVPMFMEDWHSSSCVGAYKDDLVESKRRVQLMRYKLANMRKDGQRIWCLGVWVLPSVLEACFTVVATNGTSFCDQVVLDVNCGASAAAQLLHNVHPFCHGLYSVDFGGLLHSDALAYMTHPYIASRYHARLLPVMHLRMREVYANVDTLNKNYAACLLVNQQLATSKKGLDFHAGYLLGMCCVMWVVGYWDAHNNTPKEPQLEGATLFNSTQEFTTAFDALNETLDKHKLTRFTASTRVYPEEIGAKQVYRVAFRLTHNLCVAICKALPGYLELNVPLAHVTCAKEARRTCHLLLMVLKNRLIVQTRKNRPLYRSLLERGASWFVRAPNAEANNLFGLVVNHFVCRNEFAAFTIPSTFHEGPIVTHSQVVYDVWRNIVNPEEGDATFAEFYVIYAVPCASALIRYHAPVKEINMATLRQRTAWKLIRIDGRPDPDGGVIRSISTPIAVALSAAKRYKQPCPLAIVIVATEFIHPSGLNVVRFISRPNSEVLALLSELCVHTTTKDV